MVKGRISGRSLLHIIHWSCIRGIGRTSHRSLCFGKQVGSLIVNDQNYINLSKRVAIYTFSTEADISVQVNNEKKLQIQKNVTYLPTLTIESIRL